MASTLGVLDVLSRLREESERASTALKAQEVNPPAISEGDSDIVDIVDVLSCIHLDRRTNGQPFVTPPVPVNGGTVHN